MPDSYREPIESEKSAAPAASAPGVNPLESEIIELEKKLAEKRAMINGEKPLEQILAKEQPGGSTTPPVTPGAVKTDNITVAAASIITPAQDAQAIKGYEKNQQLKMLVDMAFDKGVQHATQVVRNLDSPYLLDEFHDALVDKLHDELVQRGKLEEI